MTKILVLGVFFFAGIALQRLKGADALRTRVWRVSYFTVSPAIAFFGFTVVVVNEGTVRAVGAAIVASWLTVAAASAYAHAVSSDRDEQGAIILASSFGNVGYVGFPLAQAVLGNAGLALMVLYAQLRFVVPDTAVTKTIAHSYGRLGVKVPSGVTLVRAFITPPAVGALLAISLRAANVDATQSARNLGEMAGAMVGPIGLLLLGLSLSLSSVDYERDELAKATGAMAIKVALAPLLLFSISVLTGTDIPAAFYLGAALPCAFHIVTLARVYDVRPHMMRLLVIGSVAPSILAVTVVLVLAR